MKTNIEMAKEAGLVGGPVYARGLEAFAELVRADEREVCADAVRFADNGTEAAEIIRARGNT
jgi:hypothetical protein